MFAGRRKGPDHVGRAARLLAWCCVLVTVLLTQHVFGDTPEPMPAPSPAFDLMELRVLGNTTLTTKDIETAVYPYIGPTKQMADVEAARASLERVYHDKGFGTVFVDIPEQSVSDGVVRLRVIEGKLNQVRVSGAKYFSGRDIRAQLPSAQQGSVPNLPELQKQLTVLNSESRDRTVIPVLKAGPQPGTVDLSLRVEDHLPFHGSAELNNQYTADTAHLRAAVQASYDNVFGRMDSVSMQFQDSPTAPGESHVFATSYTLRLGDHGAGLSFQYIDSKSDVATIGTLGVLGTGSVYGLRYSQPLPTSSVVQNVALEMDYKDYKQSILVNSSSGLNTPIDYISLTAAYSGLHGNDRWQADWNTSANFGLRGTPNNAQQFAEKRSNAEANYFYLRTDGGLTLQLPVNFSASWRISGQYSVDPLINNEQLPIGGFASVRGYLEAEELGDSAVRGSFQFGAPPLNLWSGRLHLNEFLFYDVARAFTIDPLPGEMRHVDLSSWGAGFRFDGINHVYATLTWADPLNDGLRTMRGNSTVLFIVRGYW